MTIRTILFSDVVGSTSIKRDPSLGHDNATRDAAYLASIQAPHYSLVRDSYQRYGGEEVKTIGDAFYLTFDDPVSAVRSAILIQEQLSHSPITTPRGPLRVRIGIHTGAPQRFEADWQGTDVDMAARVEAAATADQILISPQTYELVRNMSDVIFHRIGEFMLKGLDRLVLWEVDWNGKGPQLTEQPPMSLDLDVPPSVREFVGRSAELEELDSLLECAPIVAIEGLSGVGKTSLALMMAHNRLRTDRLVPNGLFYFDCSQRNMRLNVAASSFLRHIAAFFAQLGEANAAAILSNEDETKDRRCAALVTTLARRRCLLFLDNLQDALDSTKHLASSSLSELFSFIMSRPIGDSRIVCASYVQWSWPSTLSIAPFRLEPLSTRDARIFLNSLGIDNPEVARRAADLVGRHPQALRWFSVLPRQLHLSVEEVIEDLVNATRPGETAAEFQRHIETELLTRVWNTLPDGAGQFLALATTFRRPIPFSALCFLNSGGSTELWRQALLDRFLLDASRRDGPHSMHQIVRVFATKYLSAGSSEWLDAHRAAARWWLTRVEPLVFAASGEFLPSREDIEAIVEAHYHLTCAGETDDAAALTTHLQPVLRSLGYRSHKQGLREETVAINRALVQLVPDDARARLYLALGLTHGKQRARAEAAEQFRHALRLNPRLVAARSGYARQLARAGKIQEADEILRAGIALDPNNGRAYAAYATLLAETNRRDDAEKYFRRAIQTASGDAWCHAAYAQCLATWGSTTTAEQQFLSALQAEPRNTAVILRYGAFLIAQKRFYEAYQQLAIARTIEPGNQRFAIIEGRYRLSYLRMLVAAAPSIVIDTEFNSALRSDPRNSFIRNLYIKYLVHHKRVIDAEKQFHDWIRATPDSGFAHNFYAKYLVKAYRLQEAEEQFRISIRTEPSNPHGRRAFVRFLAATRRFEEADIEVRALEQLGPPSAMDRSAIEYVAHQKSVALTSAGPATERIVNLSMWNTRLPVADRLAAGKAVLAKHPDNFQANYGLGRIMLDQLKDAAAAEMYLSAAVRVRPHHIAARQYHAKSLERLGRWSEALEESDAIDTTSEPIAEVHNIRANCLKELGRWADAETAYRDALRLAKPAFVAKYLNNLALLFAEWPGGNRAAEGLILCEQLEREHAYFRWTSQTKAKLPASS